MDRERLDSWCEKGILGLILFGLTFAVLATGAVRPLERIVLQAIACGVALLWIPRFWLRPDYRLLMPPISWAVLAFAAYAIFRYAQADLEYVARQELLKILVYAFFFFAILQNLHRQEWSQWIVFTLVFVAMAISIYAIYQFITNTPYVWHFIKPAQYMRRGSGTYICPNHLAGFLEMVLPLGLAATIIGRFSPAWKIFLGYASLVIVTGIAVSLSRGGWLATAAALGGFFLVLIRNHRFRIPAIAVILLLLAGGIFFAKKAYQPQKRLQAMFEEGKVQDVRFRVWKPAIQMWRDHFWLGAGPGHFDYRFRQYRPFDIQMRPLHAHNDYLNTLADWGVVGGALILAALGLLAGSAYKVWRFVLRSNDLTSKASNRASIVLGSALGLAAILVHSILDFNMQIPANALVAVTLMALISAHMRFASDRYWKNPGMFGKLAASALIAGGSLFLAVHGATGAKEYSLLTAAERAGTSSASFAKRLNLLKQAHEIEPKNFETTQKLGEMLREKSFEGNDGYQALAEEALRWFQLATEMNPFDSYNFIGVGRCLHWLGKHEEAAPYFERALARDPQGYFTLALVGWHHFQLKDYARAKEWFEKARELSLYRLNTQEPEPISTSYLKLIERKLAEQPGGR